MRIVFAGTPTAALLSLQRLIDSPRHDVTRRAYPSGCRGGPAGKTAPSPVAQMAADNGIPVLASQRGQRPGEFLAELAALGPECCAVVAYGALLSAELLTVPAHGWVNLLLAAAGLAGAAPVQA